MPGRHGETPVPEAYVTQLWNKGVALANISTSEWMLFDVRVLRFGEAQDTTSKLRLLHDSVNQSPNLWMASTNGKLHDVDMPQDGLSEIQNFTSRRHLWPPEIYLA
jgi:hypothetical protein